MCRHISILLAFVVVVFQALGQTEDPIKGRKNFGIGAGLDHGGFGVRADVHVIESVAIFGGVGYAVAGIGWNAGLIGRPLPELKVVPYVILMYGYNTAYVLKDQNTSTQVDSDLYYGPSFGGGIEVMVRKRTAFLRVGVHVPVRSDQVEIDHPDASDDLSPVLISLGYHFQI